MNLTPSFAVFYVAFCRSSNRFLTYVEDTLYPLKNQGVNELSVFSFGGWNRSLGL